METMSRMLQIGIYLALLGGCVHLLFVFLYFNWVGDFIGIDFNIILSVLYSLASLLIISIAFREIILNRIIWCKVLKQFVFLKSLFFVSKISLLSLVLALGCLSLYEILWFGANSTAIGIALTGKTELAETLFRNSKGLLGLNDQLDELSLSCIHRKNTNTSFEDLLEKESLISRVYGSKSSEMVTILNMKESYFRRELKLSDADKCRNQAISILTSSSYRERMDRFQLLKRAFPLGDSSTVLINKTLSILLIFIAVLLTAKNILVSSLLHLRINKLRSAKDIFEEISVLIDVSNLALLSKNISLASQYALIAKNRSEKIS